MKMSMMEKVSGDLTSTAATMMHAPGNISKIRVRKQAASKPPTFPPLPAIAVEPCLPKISAHQTSAFIALRINCISGLAYTKVATYHSLGAARNNRYRQLL